MSKTSVLLKQKDAENKMKKNNFHTRNPKSDRATKGDLGLWSHWSFQPGEKYCQNVASVLIHAVKVHTASNQNGVVQFNSSYKDLNMFTFHYIPI